MDYGVLSSIAHLPSTSVRIEWFVKKNEFRSQLCRFMISLTSVGRQEGDKTYD